MFRDTRYVAKFCKHTNKANGLHAPVPEQRIRWTDLDVEPMRAEPVSNDATDGFADMQFAELLGISIRFDLVEIELEREAEVYLPTL